MLACEMATVACAALAEQRRVELEPDQEHVEDDADLGEHAEERRDRRRQHERRPPGATRPSSDGPSRMPAMTSPITGGWFSFTNSAARPRAVMMMTASASSRCIKASIRSFEVAVMRVSTSVARGALRSAPKWRISRKPPTPSDSMTR